MSTGCASISEPPSAARPGQCATPEGRTAAVDRYLATGGERPKCDEACVRAFALKKACRCEGDCEVF
ncbi:MAG: hypothetical protein EOP11_26225 [Proteobacteria bacterium]|nr:MAG: hypothetical protein EOP11_26225 [Pseudomonadota bacterium]